MGKLRIQNRFWVIPTSVLNHTGLTLKAKGLYGYIQSKPDGWDFSAGKIAKQNKDGIDGVSSALRELEAEWYLVREKTNNRENGQWEIEYTLYETPITTRENPVTDETTITENPSTENPSTENPLTNSNIDLSKIDLSKKEVVAVEKKKLFYWKEEKVIEIFDLATDPEIYDLYSKFAKIRKDSRYPMNEASEKLFFWKFRDIDPRLHDRRKEIAKKMILKAIEMGWRTVFPLKPREVEEYIAEAERKKVKKAEIREMKTQEVERKKESETKSMILRYWSERSEEEKQEIEMEAEKNIRDKNPNISEERIKPLILIERKRIIIQRLHEWKN